MVNYTSDEAHRQTTLDRLHLKKKGADIPFGNTSQTWRTLLDNFGIILYRSLIVPLKRPKSAMNLS